jgi:RNA polymerase sigma-70 factor (ECF subfamily)
MFNPLCTFLPGTTPWRGGPHYDPAVARDIGRGDGSVVMGIPAPAGGEAGQGGTGRAGAGLASAASDDAVLTALYRQYRGPLLLFVLRLTAGDRQQAEDVVQETMVRAWREARRLDLSQPSLMPWLATVARRIVIDEHRRKSARPPEIGGAEVVDRAPAAADETESLLRKLLVVEALQALSAAHREVLNETILRDRTVNEAAEVLGVPVGTVKSRVYYALKALRVALTERGVSA